MQYIIQSASYAIGIISCLLIIMIMAALFDSKELTGTFKAYALAYGYIYAIAWLIPAICRAVKKEFVK